MSATPYDQVRTLYRTLIAYALVATVILTLGLIEFVYFEPPGETSGASARIAGVFAYEPATGNVVGTDSSTFTRSQDFAAIVDWPGLPPNLSVDARWYDSFGNVVGRVGPSTPANLGPTTLVPVIVPPGPTHHNLPGHYSFVVERLQDGRPVEVLARRIVLVERS